MTKRPLQDLTVGLEKKLKISSCLVWFRSDLRVSDHHALFRSSFIDAFKVGIFVVSPSEWKAHDLAAVKVDFILRNVKELQQRLKELGIPLLVITENEKSNVPNRILECSKIFNAEAVVWNKEYEVNESKRDQITRELLEKHQIKALEFHDQCIMEPGQIKTKEGKIWIHSAQANPKSLALYETVKSQELSKLPTDWIQYIEKNSKIPTMQSIGFQFPSTLKVNIEKDWPAGELEAQKRLEIFIENVGKEYHSTRDFPSQNGTSKLSAYLACGVISPRMCFKAAKEANSGKLDSGSQGLLIWMSELIWREFYRHILFAYPRVCKNKAFKKDMDSIPWKYDQELFDRWCKGTTGYPIVDAGMRQLNETGWMHNRLRMIVAMFLTKHLLIDWRWGEKYFMNHLIDGDFASNNGGWQWASSTGTDSQPYFRIFNPELQATRFDAKATFIRSFIPELKNVKNAIDPWNPKGPKVDSSYPKPIVDHKKARDACLDAFKTTLAKLKK